MLYLSGLIGVMEGLTFVATFAAAGAGAAAAGSFKVAGAFSWCGNGVPWTAAMRYRSSSLMRC